MMKIQDVRQTKVVAYTKCTQIKAERKSIVTRAARREKAKINKAKNNQPKETKFASPAPLRCVTKMF